MRKRLLVLTSTFPRWAGDNQPPFVFELCRRLADHYEIFILAPHTGGAQEREALNGLRVERFRYCFVRAEVLAYGGGILTNLKRNPFAYALVPLFLLAQLISAVRIVRRENIDLMHAHWLIPQGVIGGLIRTFLRPSPVLLCTSHGSDIHGLAGATFSALKRWVMKKADAMTVVSTALLDAASASGGDTSKIHVIPMGIDAAALFTPDPAVQRDSGTLLFVGRLVASKGVAVLIRALTAVAQRYPGVKLQIVGSGPEEHRLKELARRCGVLDNVQFLGAMTNVRLPQLYRKATLFISPSLSEGFGLTLAEALACECPVIATDIPGIRNLVIDGITGTTVPENDPEKLAEKILALLGDPNLRRQLAERGRDHVRSTCDWTATVARYRELIDSLPV
ncbi:MAG: glycosyltransferase family 4 protein [Acidiferrobacterales bacterium]